MKANDLLEIDRGMDFFAPPRQKQLAAAAAAAAASVFTVAQGQCAGHLVLIHVEMACLSRVNDRNACYRIQITHVVSIWLSFEITFFVFKLRSLPTLRRRKFASKTINSTLIIFNFPQQYQNATDVIFVNITRFFMVASRRKSLYGQRRAGTRHG